MELSARQSQILEYLRQHSEAQIEALAQMLNVTTQTIRRDVNALCEQGFARRVHGGISLPASLTNSSYQYRSAVAADAKLSLARRAARMIPEGATVFIGIGTSLTHVARFLSDANNLRVITNNLQVERILEVNPGVEVFLAGGRVRSEHQDIVGQSVVSFFNSFEADIAIVSCAAVSKSLSTMEHEPHEAETCRALLDNARQTWLIADSSKWERCASVRVASLHSFSKIFTNQENLPTDLPIFGPEPDEHQTP